MLLPPLVADAGGPAAALTLYQTRLMPRGGLSAQMTSSARLLFHGKHVKHWKNI